MEELEREMTMSDKVVPVVAVTLALAQRSSSLGTGLRLPELNRIIIKY